MTTAVAERNETTNGHEPKVDPDTMMMPAANEPRLPARQSDDTLGLLSALIDSQAWNRLVKIADVFSKSKLVPKHFQGNMADCMIALQLSIRMGVDPFMLMQNMYVVHGRPGIEAKLAIALANSKRVFRGPIRYSLTGSGMQRQCTAWAIDRETGDRLEETVTMEIAKKEGWMGKDGSKWQTIPDLMLKYRSAMWLIRTTCPEVLMGLQTTDELEDIGPETEYVPQRNERLVHDTKAGSDRLADILQGESGTSEPETGNTESPPETADPGTSNQFACGDQEEAHDWLDRLKRSIPEAQSPDVLDRIAAAAQDHGGRLADDDVAEVTNRVSRRKATIEKARKAGSLTA